MNVIAFLVAFALFVAGLVMMGYAFYVEGFELVMFLGGILVSSLAVAIPIHVLKRIAD
jgi:cytochrome b subunit of formate dehydrogenase